MSSVRALKQRPHVSALQRTGLKHRLQGEGPVGRPFVGHKPGAVHSLLVWSAKQGSLAMQICRQLEPFASSQKIAFKSHCNRTGVRGASMCNMADHGF